MIKTRADELLLLYAKCQLVNFSGLLFIHGSNNHLNVLYKNLHASCCFIFRKEDINKSYTGVH